MIVHFTIPEDPDDELYCAACGYVPTPGEAFVQDQPRQGDWHYYCNARCADEHAEQEMLALFG